MSYITISKDNYFYNLQRVVERVESIEQVAVVLKDNAYGHGLSIMANLAKEFGVKRAVVRNLQEAEEIKELFEYILILAPDGVVERENYFYTINSIDDIYKYGKNINLELKIDTGMHRLGISPMELYFAMNLIKNRSLRLRGFFTHFREADELSSTLFVQRELFKTLKENVIDSCFNDLNIHSNNSAGLFRSGQKISSEMVRVGIASYGYLSGDNSLKFPSLKPVLSLWGERVGGLNYLKKGFRVGYGGVSKVENPKDRLSVYDIGYADGFKRLPEKDIVSRTFQTPNGNYLYGKVSMDSTIFNSHKEDLEIFNSVSDLAKIFNTIEYEILVGLSERIKRRVI